MLADVFTSLTQCRLVLIFLHTLSLVKANTMLWDSWWSYSGISGPPFWGVLNKDWSLCKQGRFQSPVDINPRTLLYDPNLRPVRIDAHAVDGLFVNTGHDLTFYVNETFPRPFSFTGGPLSYTYRVHHVSLHFGREDDMGSEHTIWGRTFPLELQIYGFNRDLYNTFEEAVQAAHGVATIAIFGMVSDESNKEFEVMAKSLHNVPYKGNSTTLYNFSIYDLLPNTRDYMTYEGSMTQPGCLETVTWIVFNKPMHIRKDQLALMRTLHKSGDISGQKNLLMENNYRPTMSMNRRTIRTNIQSKSQAALCGMQKYTFYEVNDKYLLN